jgi:hypothetical protein
VGHGILVGKRDKWLKSFQDTLEINGVSYLGTVFPAVNGLSLALEIGTEGPDG